VKNLFPVPHTHIVIASSEAIDVELGWSLILLPDKQFEFHDGKASFAKFLPRTRPVVRDV